MNGKTIIMSTILVAVAVLLLSGIVLAQYSTMPTTVATTATTTIIANTLPPAGSTTTICPLNIPCPIYSTTTICPKNAPCAIQNTTTTIPVNRCPKFYWYNSSAGSTSAGSPSGKCQPQIISAACPANTPNSPYYYVCGPVTAAICPPRGYTFNSAKSECLISASAVPPKITPPNTNGNNQTYLQNAMQTLNCRTAYVTTQVNSIIAVVPSLSTLSSNVTLIGTENAQLQVYVNNGNVVSFSAYLHGTYDPTLGGTYKTARAGLKAANLNSTTKAALQKQLNAANNAYTACGESATSAIANLRINDYVTLIAEFNNQTTYLASKGVNTTNMTIVIQGGQTQIVQPLQNAITNAGTNTTQIENALAQYCLFNGCAKGLNYHLDAKYSIAKLYAIVARLRNATTDTTDLNNAQISLNTASTELAAVGTAQYTSGNGQQIWANIQTAAADITLALKNSK